MMVNSLKIEAITNGLLTLQKVRDLYKNDHRSTEGDDDINDDVHPDKLMLMREVLTAVTEFMPRTRSGTFSSAFDQGTRFSSAYRDLKHHIGGMSRGGPAQEDIFRTFKLLLPVLDFRHRIYVDKVVKIIDILMS
ncbi:MAG: hypothetical protein GX279_01545 [Clostridiaceae bacterium]|nr:hypothetical protein [Clostridiaceae bacterium]